MDDVDSTLFWRPSAFESELILTVVREATEISRELGIDIAILKSLYICAADRAPEHRIAEIIRSTNATDPDARFGH